jgi:heat shock protein HslJ
MDPQHPTDDNRDASLDGTAWTVVEIAGVPVLVGAAPTLGFADGALFGSGGVNRYRGGYRIADGRLVVGGVASTMMAGDPAVMEQEHRWFQALAAPVVLRHEPPDLLCFVHADGTVSRLARFVPDEPTQR